MSVQAIPSYYYGVNSVASMPQKAGVVSLQQVSNPCGGGYRGVNAPNFRGLEKDTVDISATEEIKKQEKSGMSTGAKWALGIATTTAAVYGCVVGHRMLNKPSIEKVAKNFSEIFRRDVSKEEAQKLVERYREIIKISKTDEYLEKLFEMVKKDYGFNDMELKLIVSKLEDGSFKSFREHSIGGSAGILNKEVVIYPLTSGNNLLSSAQRTSFGTMFHELHHIRQDLHAYRTNPQKLIDAYCKRLENNHPEFIEMLMRENGCSRTIAVKDMRADIEKTLNELFGKYSKFKPNSAEYKKGMDYINNIEKYIEDGPEHFTQLVEKEAHEISAQARQIFDYCANPWRIF